MIIESMTTALIGFVSLLCAAFTKIMIMFLTVLMVFFFLVCQTGGGMFIGN